jgi:hypothetical protein
LGGILEDYTPGAVASESKNEYSSHKVMPPVGPGKNYVRAQQHTKHFKNYVDN